MLCRKTLQIEKAFAMIVLQKQIIPLKRSKQMQDNCIKLSIDLPDVYVKCYEEINNVIYIRVSPIKKSLKCPKCGSIADRLHDVVEYTIRDLDILGKKVVLVVEKVRLRCAHCYHRGIPIKVSFLQKYQRKTDRFLNYIANAVSKTSINEVSEELEIGYQETKSTFDNYADELIEKSKEGLYKEGVEYFGIDEFAVKKGHKYAVAIINPYSDTNKIVDILDSRKKEDLVAYFKNWPVNIRNGLKFVTMDMWNGYNSSINEMFPNAKVIIDKFHVVSKVNDALEQVRKNLKSTFNEELRTQIFKDRFLLTSGNENVNDEDYSRLLGYFEECAYLEIAYELKEEFRDIYMLTDKKEAIDAFENWCKKVKENRIKEYYKVIKTVRNWFAEIFNYFEARLTNGPIEGINNKIKLIKRTGFGFSSYANIKRRIFARFAK